MEATISGGTISSGFYSYATSVAGLAFLAWLFIVSISMLVVRKHS